MRAAEYVIPHAPGDSEDGECIVITFGPGQGGGVDENVSRWVAQFSGATGPERSQRETHGLHVSRVEVAGDLHAHAHARDAVRSLERVWVATHRRDCPSAERSLFFKMTGPSATVKAAAAELEAMLDTASVSAR